MSKYEKLWLYVQSARAPYLKLTFEQIKEFSGAEIDHSFLTYKKELCDFGYKVGKISLKEKTVVFEKIV